MLTEPRNEKEEEFQQVRKLIVLSCEHLGNQDILPEAETVDLVLFIFLVG